MAANQRKRSADPSWISQEPSKASRVVNSNKANPHPKPIPTDQTCIGSRNPQSSQVSKPNYSHRQSVKDVESPNASIPQRPTKQSRVQTKQRFSTLRSSGSERGLTQPQSGRVPPTALQRAVYKPQVLHRPHVDSRIEKDFHWTPYPLGLMPYDSWHKLHHRPDVHPPLPFRCPVCKSERIATPHIRKVYLVAERLTWEEGLVSSSEKDQNEELNWAVNYELGIFDPFVEDPETVPGGKNSQEDKFYPYQNEYEMRQALKLIFSSENITEATWSLWIGMHMDLQKKLGALDIGYQKMNTKDRLSSKENVLQSRPGNNTRLKTPELGEIDLTMSPECASKRQPNNNAFGSFTPTTAIPDSTKNEIPSKAQAKASPNRLTRPPSFTMSGHVLSYKTLQDFYSLLDRIERTSYVGALFLEAYAERLQTDMCRNCWLKRYIESNASD